MKQLACSFSFLLLLALPALVFAGGYSVDASSYNWMAQRDYSQYRIADDDPATAWAEGGTGAGEGEWVSFDFESDLHLARIGVRNGDQRPGSWESCNRVREMRVEYGHGREKVVELRNQTGLQYVDIAAESVDELKLTIVSVYPAENIWNRSVTCISDVTFEVYADAEAIAAAAGREVAAAAQQSEPETGAAAKHPQDAKPLASSPPPARVPLAAQSKPKKPMAQAAKAKPVPAATKKDGATPPMADPAGEAVNIVREYYNRLNTLDETFPELMAAKVYEQEMLSFYYFEEIQKQLGTDDKLRKAQVDLSDLAVEVVELTDISARVTAKGAYSVATPGQKLMLDENSRFDLVLEQGVWKIEKKVEE